MARFVECSRLFPKSPLLVLNWAWSANQPQNSQLNFELFSFVFGFSSIIRRVVLCSKNIPLINPRKSNKNDGDLP